MPPDNLLRMRATPLVDVSQVNIKHDLMTPYHVNFLFNALSGNGRIHRRFFGFVPHLPQNVLANFSHSSNGFNMLYYLMDTEIGTQSS